MRGIVLPALAVLLLAGCDGGSDVTAELTSMAQREATCASAADCCVVVDGCSATAYVVARGDYEEGLRLAEQSPKPCVKCMSPAVEVRCEAGACVGVEVGFDEEPATYGSHCGGTAGEATQPLSSDAGEPAGEGRMFGCGVD